jgi:hypothetical protein
MEVRTTRKPGLISDLLLTSILLGVWVPLGAGLTVILSLISREGEGNHRTRPGHIEEPIYFCFLIFIALLLYLRLPRVPSRDVSWATFLGTVGIRQWECDQPGWRSKAGEWRSLLWISMCISVYMLCIFFKCVSVLMKVCVHGV